MVYKKAERIRCALPFFISFVAVVNLPFLAVYCRGVSHTLLCACFLSIRVPVSLFSSIPMSSPATSMRTPVPSTTLPSSCRSTITSPSNPTAADANSKLLIAARSGRVNDIESLLDAGASTEVVDGNGWTALVGTISKKWN